MKTSLNIGLKQTQRLVMTQSLRQSIEILQMSTIELSEKISQEFLENPFLEELNFQQVENPVEAAINRNLSGDENHEVRKSDENDIFADSSDTGFIKTGADEDKNRSFIENAVSSKEGLIEHLLWQARMSAESEHLYQIYEEFITSLNEDGFYENDVFEELIHKYGKDTVVGIKKNVQSFDPNGCGTSGVSESLTVQSKIFFADDPVILEMIEKYYDDIIKLDYESISRKMSLPMDVIVEKSKLLHNLNPFPGRLFSSIEVKYIVPDVDVRLLDEDIIVTINDDWIPSIKLSSYYARLLKEKKVNNEQKEYLNEKLQSAKALIKNISHRRDTIKSVVTSIMEKQRGFLENGPGHLTYLTHHDVAEEVGVHESTVSRVANSKFVQTSWGTFAIKYFFVSRIKSKTGEEEDDHSSDVVKNKISQIINDENSDDPYSDEAIVVILKESGFTVARRTVAKYRGVLNIPSSNKRKRLNKIKS